MDLGHNNKIDTKLLALINNDVFITGARNLAGAPYEQTISYMQHFISDRRNSGLIKSIFSSREEDKEYNAFTDKLNSLLLASKEIKAIRSNLDKLPKNEASRYGTLYKSEKDIENTINNGCRSLTSRVVRLNKSTDAFPNSVLIPGGWAGKPGESGHAIAYEFKKDKNGDYLFLVYNSGAGLTFHENVTSADKDRYKTVKAYKIPKTATEDELNYFLSELIKPTVLPVVQDKEQRNEKEDEYDETKLYQQVFRKISYLNGGEIPLEQAELNKATQRLASVGQRAGTCAEKSLQELMKLSIKDQNKGKALIFFFKLFSIEEFIEQNSISMEIKKTSQLKWSAQNLSKLLIQQKDSLPEALHIRATETLEKVQGILAKEKNKKKLTQTQMLDGITKLFGKHVSAEHIVTQRGNISTVSVKPSDAFVIEKAFYAEKESIAHTLINSKTLNIELLREFRKKILKHKADGLNKDAEQALFDYFTQTPFIYKDYFSFVTTKEALEYIELNNALASEYMEIMKANGMSDSHPKKAAVLLNMTESLDALYQIDAVKMVHTSGIDSFCSYGGGFSEFKAKQAYNAYLSTDIPVVDKRTKEIIESNVDKVSGGKKRYCTEITLDALMDNINRPENQKFKGFLIDLFDKNSPKSSAMPEGDARLKEYLEKSMGISPNTMWADRGFSKQEYCSPDAAGRNNRKALTAYFLYFTQEMSKPEYANNPSHFSTAFNELNKLNLFKKMKKNCDNMRYIQFSSSLDISYDKILNADRAIMHNGQENMSHDFNIKNRTALTINAIDNLRLYFNPIKEQYDVNPLEKDQRITKDDHKAAYSDNEIFFYPDGVKVEGAKIQNENGRLHQKLMHLRTAPDLQIMTTIDYFRDQFYLFSNKMTEENKDGRLEKDNPLKKDMQEYLRRNLFQPGLLLKEFERNPDSYEVIKNEFTEKGILFFTKNNKITDETLFFYNLQQDIDAYALKSANIPNKQNIFNNMADAYRTLDAINQGELSQPERYELSKIKLKTQLTLLDSIKKELTYRGDQGVSIYKTLFQSYMNFSQNARDIASVSAESTEELKRVKHLSVEFLKQEPAKSKVFEWALEYIKEKKLFGENKQLQAEVENANHQQITGQFPYFYITDRFGKNIVSIDMLEGQVLIGGTYNGYPPDQLVQSEIYQLVCGTERPMMSTSIVQNTGLSSIGRNIRIYKLPNDTEDNGKFIEVPFRDAPFVYQKDINIRGKKTLFERKVLTPEIRRNEVSLTISDKKDIAPAVSLHLPESFYSKETACWAACDSKNTGAIYIEKMNGKYVVDLEPDSKIGLVKELDDQKNETGYILRTDYQDAKVQAVLEVFKSFDAPEFTEILFKPSNNLSRQLEEIKVKFPRYNLELKGRFDVKTQKWEIYQESDPDLVLVHDQNIQIKPNIDISNSLIFENKQTKQQFLYTPVQDFYINPQEKYDERSSDTVYYKPKLDNVNAAKRIRQGRPLYQEGKKQGLFQNRPNFTEQQPSGTTTYSQSETFRVFPIDANTKEIKTATTEDKLHLAYLNLVNLQPEEALNSIRSIIKTGGLKGTFNELVLIDQIFNRAPLDASSIEINPKVRIDSPEFVAVRMHVLYLISELYAQKHTFPIPDVKKIEVKTPDDFIQKKQVEILKTFESSIPDLMHEHLKTTLNIHSAIPKEMRLAKALEYKMIPRLENGYHLQLLDTPDVGLIDLMKDILEAPVLIRKPATNSEKAQYWILGKDINGRNQVKSIKQMDLMNTFQFSDSKNLDKLNSIYVSEEKNRGLFLEIQNIGAHIYQAKTVPIQARYQHLKNWYRTRELAKMDNGDAKNNIIKAHLEEKVTKPKQTNSYIKKVETKDVVIPLIEIIETKGKERPHDGPDKSYFTTKNNSSIYLDISEERAKELISLQGEDTTLNLKDLQPNLTNEQFLERIIPILNLARSNKSTNRDKLEIFLKNTLKASSKILPEEQNSLIRNWAPSILTVIENAQYFSGIYLEPEKLKTYNTSEFRYSNSGQVSRDHNVKKTIIGNPDRHHDFVKDFLAKAYSLSGAKKTYTVQIQDYQYYLDKSVNISSKKFKTKKYVPLPMKVEVSKEYNNITYDDFIQVATLEPFYKEINKIKEERVQESEIIKIRLDMAIRENSVSQKIELIEAQLKAKKSGVLESKLESARTEYQIIQQKIDRIKQKIEANFKKPASPETLAERNLLRDKFRALTKEGRYQDTAETKRQYDEEIGALKNKEDQAIHTSICHLLNDKTRKKASEVCTQFISIINPKIEKLEKTLLDLANKGPKDLTAQQEYKRALQARKREPLTFSDLNRLFVISDKNEYKKITGLDEDDIEKLYQEMAVYTNLGILKQQYTRMIVALDNTESTFFALDDQSDKKNKAIDLGRMLATNNMISPTGDTDIQFFQKEENILITPLQKFYLDILLKRDDITNEYKNEVIQLIMGGGKSKVLGPLSMLKKANGVNLPIFQVKSSLLKTNFADMHGTSMRLFNQEAVLFEFDRNTHCSSKDLKEIYNKFHKTALNKGYVVTSGTSLQSLELKYLEILAEVPESTDPRNAEYQKWSKQIKWFERTLDFIQTKGDRLIDEVHDELDSNKELNYTIGDAKPPSKDDISLVIDTFYFLKDVSLSKKELGIDKDIKAIDLIYNNKFITSPKEQMALIMDKIVDDLVNNLNTPNLNPIAKIVNKINLKDESEKQLLKAYLLNQNDEILDKLKLSLTPKELKALAFVKSQVSKFLPVTLLKNYNENYGPSRIENLSEIKRKMAIPYTDLNTPNERSRFGEFTEAMNYTIQMNFIEPLSSELVREITIDYIDRARKEEADYANTTFDNTSACIDYNVKFKKIDKPTLEQIKNYAFDDTIQTFSDDKLKMVLSLFFNDKISIKDLKNNIEAAFKESDMPFSESQAAKQFETKYVLNQQVLKEIDLNAISKFNEKQLDCFVNILKNSDKFKKSVLTDHILRQVENNPLVLTHNTQDSGDMTHTTQAMSGTPHNFKAYHRNIHFDEYQGLGTDGETISLLKNKKTPVVESADYESVIGLLEEYHNNNTLPEDQRRNTRAIIDAGALFKKEKSNFNIAKQIGEYTQGNHDKFSCEIKYVLYFENKGDILHAWDIQNQKKIRLGTSDEKEIAKILNCKPEERFTFYDQARITGTDIVQASGVNIVKDSKTGQEFKFSANAVLTFSEKTSKFAFLQAAKRMRQLHNNQTINVIKADYLKKRLPNDHIDDVLAFVNQVQVDKALSLHFKATGHKFKNVLRRDFMNRIRHQEKDPVKKSKLLKKFEAVFYKQFKPDHFANHGAVETIQDAMLYFPVMAQNYYKQWGELLSTAGIDAKPDEEKNMKKILDLLAEDAIDICEKEFKSKPLTTEEGAAPQEDNMGNEVENELQNELEMQLQKEMELEKEIVTYDKNKTKNTGNHYTLSNNANMLVANDFDSLYSIQKVIPNVPLDSHIFMTGLQRQTVNGRFEHYYDQYIKPFDVVMMVAQKNKPETLQCVILTKEEAQKHIDNRVHANQPNRDIWFVSCKDTVLSGQKPTWLQIDEENAKSDVNCQKYNRTLEQIRYVNGDLNAIMKQKEGLSWLTIDSQKKLTYLTESILKRFPESVKYYNNLQSRLDITVEIFNYMQTHPFENYADPDYDWHETSKNYGDISEEGKIRITQFAEALSQINSIYDNNYEDGRLSKNVIEKTYSPEIAYRINQYKQNFLDLRTAVIKALTENKSLDILLAGDAYKNMDLNFWVNKKTLFQIALDKNISIKNMESLVTRGHIRWDQKNGETPPVSNAELLALYAIEKNKKENKNINEILLEMAGGPSQKPDKVNKLIYDKKNKNLSLLIFAVKYNNVALLKCIEENYLIAFEEKELIEVLEVAQKQLTQRSSPEIVKLIQTNGKNGDLVEKHKRLRTVVFDRINNCIESDYEILPKINFSQKPFSLKLNFDTFTEEDNNFVKSVVDKLVQKPNKEVFKYFNDKLVFFDPKMVSKKILNTQTVLTDIIKNSEKVLDKDLNEIISILIANKAEVKSVFALALESGKSKTVLGHLKEQKSVDIHFNPEISDSKQFLLLRKYKTDSVEEIVRKIKIYHSLNTNFNTLLDSKGNTILHSVCFLENEQKKLEEIIRALSSVEICNLNAKNSAGSTALHTAITQGNTAMVKVLLAQQDNKKQDKIDIDIKDGNNKTAMDLVAEALQKNEAYKPEIVKLVTEAYKRKYKDDYLEEIPAEKMLADEIWFYLNEQHSIKDNAFKDKTLVNRIIHANARNETEFNIQKSAFYKRLNTNLDNKLSVNFIDCVDLYDNIQLDKDLLGKEQKIEDFDAPKLAEIKKEKLDEFPNQWSRSDIIAIQALREVNQNISAQGEQSSVSDALKITMFLNTVLDKHAKTVEEYYDAKKDFVSYIKKQAELNPDDAIFSKTETSRILNSLTINAHKFFPRYKALESDKTTQVKPEEGIVDSVPPEKDWDKIAYGYLADVISSGQYLNRYQEIPFNDFINSNAFSQEEVEKLKAETKKYLNLVFQDSPREKEVTIGALDKVNFKSKVNDSNISEIEKLQEINKHERLVNEVLKRAESYSGAIHPKNKTKINIDLHSISKNQTEYNEIVKELNKIVVQRIESGNSFYKSAAFAKNVTSFQYDEKLHSVIKEAETKNERKLEKNTSISVYEQRNNDTKEKNRKLPTTKFYDKDYSVIAREIYNFAIPFTNNYQKPFNSAFKIKLKEQAKTQEDFDEITSELKVLFKKMLLSQSVDKKQSEIATQMLNAVKATDLGFKSNVSKAEPKVELKAPVLPQNRQQPKPAVVTTKAVKPPVQSQPSVDLTQTAKLVEKLEGCLPDNYNAISKLKSEIHQELKKLEKLMISEDHLKDLKNAYQILKSFMNYEKFINSEKNINKEIVQIPQALIQTLSECQKDHSTNELDRADFKFIQEYLEAVKNLDLKIKTSLDEVENLLKSKQIIKPNAIKNYAQYMSELEKLAFEYKKFEAIVIKHKFLDSYQIKYVDSSGFLELPMLHMVMSCSQRLLEIEKITSQTCNLIANISNTDRSKLLPNKSNILVRIEEIMKLLKEQSTFSLANAKQMKSSVTVSVPTFSSKPMTQQPSLSQKPESQPEEIKPTSPVVIPQKLTIATELIAQIENYVPNQLDKVKKLNSEMYQELKKITLLKNKLENQAIKQELEKNYTNLMQAREVLEPFVRYKELMDTEQALHDQFKRIPKSFIQDLEQKIDAEKSNPSVQKDLIFAKDYIEKARNLPDKIKPALSELNNVLKINQGVGLDKMSNYVQYMAELETLTAEYTKFQKIANTFDFDNKYVVPEGNFSGIAKELKFMTLMSPCFQRIMRIKDLTSDTCNLIAKVNSGEKLKSYPKTKSFFIDFEQNMKLLKDKSAEASLNANEREAGLAYNDLIAKIKKTTIDEKNGLSIEQITEFENLYTTLDEKGSKPLIDYVTYEKLNKSLKLILSADTSWGSWLSAGTTTLKSNLIGLSDGEEKKQKNKKIKLEHYEKLKTSFEKIGKKIKIESEKQEKNDLIKDYNTHVSEIKKLLEDVNTLKSLKKKLSYEKFNAVLTSAEKFYTSNKASSFFADAEKINLDKKIADLSLARTNFLVSLKSEIEDQIVAKPQSDLQVEKKQFEEFLSNFNNPELIYSAFEKVEKEDLTKKIKDKIQSIEKLINPVTPTVMPPQSLQPAQSIEPEKIPTFNLALRCKTTGWHNNCGLNCLTHFIYNKLESKDIQTHFSNDPGYTLLREAFKEYYNLNITPTWEQIKTILDEYPVAHDKEAVLSPVFRVYLSKCIMNNMDDIWKTEASAGILEYFRTGKAKDVGLPIVNTNKKRIEELKKQFDLEVKQARDPSTFTSEEIGKAKEYIKKWNEEAKIYNKKEVEEWNKGLDEWNKHPDTVGNKRRKRTKKVERILKNPNHFNEEVIFRRVDAIENKYLTDIESKEWKAKNGLCETYAKHMAILSKNELISANQLGFITKQLGLELQVFTDLGPGFTMRPDVLPQASQHWLLKVYNPSEIHWEYEEPNGSADKAREHNKSYTLSNSSIFHTFGSVGAIADDEIKKSIVQKWTEKGFAIPFVSAQNTGDVPSIPPPTIPNVGTNAQQPNQVQSGQSSSGAFDANMIADKIYQEAKDQTKDFTVVDLKMFSEKINKEVSNETDFNAVVKVLKEEVLHLYLDQDPSKLNKVIQMLDIPTYSPQVPLQPQVTPSSQPTSTGSMPSTPSVPVQQSPIVTPTIPEGAVPQHVANAVNQVSQQPVTVNNPNSLPVQQPTVPQGSGTVMQSQQNIPPISGQAFLPGFDGGGQTKPQSVLEAKTPNQKAQEVLAIAESYAGGIHPKNKGKINMTIHTLCNDESEFNKIVSEINKIVSENTTKGVTQYKSAVFAKNAAAFLYDAKLHPAKSTGPGSGP